MIVVGIDGSELGSAALRFALDEAALRQTRVRALHAWSAIPIVPVAGPELIEQYDPEPVHKAALKLLEDVVVTVAGDRADEIERVVVQGPAGEALLEHSHDAELIVVGTHGHGAIAELIVGSVSHHVIKHARCPVVVIPPARD